MKSWKFLAFAVGGTLLAICGVVLAQAPTNPVPPLPGPPASVKVPTQPELSPDPEPIPSVQRKAEDQTLEQLLDAVEIVRAQKAELEKKEQALRKALQKKMEKLKERIEKLDVGTPPVAPANVSRG